MSCGCESAEILLYAKQAQHHQHQGEPQQRKKYVLFRYYFILTIDVLAHEATCDIENLIG